ncbi:MAG: helix-turn-helix domain-containing protein [Bacilli bacterium]
MRFSEKLTLLRKKNNFSQEELAGKLEISRQAVSKWESGSSYPDMEKILLICKILNCTLEELMDDGSIGNNKAQKQEKNYNEIIINKFNSFLSLITKTYNMFSAMTFKQKIMCVIEMFILGIILGVISIICGLIFTYLLHTILFILPIKLLNLIFGFVCIILFVIDTIIFFHIFKVRFLDYYITIEDNNSLKKEIEVSIENNESKKYIEKEKQKIIIRDVNHSGINLIQSIKSFVLLSAKFLLIIFGVGILSLLFIACITGAISIMHIKYIIFIETFFISLGVIIMSVVSLEFIFKFIFNQKFNLKRLFITLICGFIISSLSVGFLIDTSFKMTTIKKDNNEISEFIFEKNETEYFQASVYEVNYIIDEFRKDIKFEFKYNKPVYLNSYETGTKYFSYDDTMYLNTFKEFINNIENNKIYIYNSPVLNIYGSSDNINYIKNKSAVRILK